MGTNRKIKSDGSVEIESSATTVSGTLGVTGNTTVTSINGLSFPTADGTADQVIKTDGSGNLSFTDMSAGDVSTDVISNATEAANYTGTAPNIEITATQNITFTNDMIGRNIYYNSAGGITIELKCDLIINCKIHMDSGTLRIKSKYDPDVATTANHLNVKNTDIRSQAIEIQPGGYISGATGFSHSGRVVYFENCNVYSQAGNGSNNMFGPNFVEFTNTTFTQWTTEPKVIFKGSRLAVNYQANASVKVDFNKCNHVMIAWAETSDDYDTNTFGQYQQTSPNIIQFTETATTCSNTFSFNQGSSSSQNIIS